MTFFPYATPVSPDRFIGRQDEIFDLTSLVRAGQSRIIVGEPRIGKTSLLRYLEAPAALGADPALILSYTSAHTLGTAVSETVFWTEILRPLDATPYAAAYHAAAPFETTKVARLLKAIGARAQRLVVLLDELDYLVEGRDPHDSALFAALRALINDSEGAFCLVGTSRLPVARLNEISIGHGGSPYFNVLPDFPLGAFTDDDLDTLLRPVEACLSPTDRRFIQVLSGGYPYLASAATHFLLRARAPTPTERHGIASAELYDEASQTLAEIWSRWAPRKRQVFASIAIEHLDALGARVDWLAGVGPVAETATHPGEIRALVKHGFITPAPSTPSGYTIRPVAFLAWCALKFRDHAHSARDFATWLDAEGWTRQRPLWENAIRPRAATVRTDIETLLAAHTAILAARPSPPAAAYIPPRPRKVRIFSSQATSDRDYACRFEPHPAPLYGESVIETHSTLDLAPPSDVLHCRDKVAAALADDNVKAEFARHGRNIGVPCDGEERRTLRTESAVHEDPRHQPPPENVAPSPSVTAPNSTLARVSASPGAPTPFPQSRSGLAPHPISPKKPMTLQVHGPRYEQLVIALTKAFPSRARLERMLQFRLDKHLNELTTESIALPDAIFEVIRAANAEGWTLPLINAARASNPGNPQLFVLCQALGLAPATPAQSELERLVRQTNSYLDLNDWRTRLGEIEAQVCRIEVGQGDRQTFGTGFLVGPDLVITNHHVVSRVIKDTVDPTEVVLRFDHKRLANGNVVDPGTEYRLAATDWLLDYSPPSPLDVGRGDADPGELDYALLRVAGSPGERPVGQHAEPGAPMRRWIVPVAEEHAFAPGTPLFIVQHPRATPIKLALDTDAIVGLNGNGTRVRYLTNTEPGSSGSPCFDQSWNLVALHHAGGPDSPFGHTAEYNEGIPFAKIVAHLRRPGVGIKLPRLPE